MPHYSKNIYLFYITEGSGHFRAAYNIYENLKAKYPNLNTFFINIFFHFFPLSEKVINLIYAIIIRKLPFIWDILYDKRVVVQSLSPLSKIVKKFSFPKLDRLFRNNPPSVVVTTQAFPCGLVCFYKRKARRKFLVLAVITDYLPHGFWIEEGVDYFTVSSDEAYEYLVERGVPRGRILKFGMPLHPGFYTDLSKEDILKEFALSSRNRVLVMGGGQGLGPIEETVSLLDKLDESLDILVVCGKNKKLYRKLKNKKFSKKVLVFGYVEYIEKLMHVSDIIITKPGGITLAEALYKNLCIIALKPLPGQEKNNMRFFKRHNLGDLAYSAREAVLKVKMYLDNPRLLERRKMHIQTYLKDKSGDFIDFIISKVK